MCPYDQEEKNTVSWLRITKALAHTISAASSKTAVGNHSFFLLLWAPRTPVPWSCHSLEATARLQCACSSPPQHCSPAEMVLHILWTQRSLSHLPNVPKATKCQGQDWNSGPQVRSSGLFPLHHFGLLCWWDKEELWEKTIIKWPGTGLSTRHKWFHLRPTTRKFSHHAHVMDEKQSPREGT